MKVTDDKGTTMATESGKHTIAFITAFGYQLIRSEYIKFFII